MSDDDGTIFPALADHRCPDCSGRIWRPGPRGGLSRNIECVGCKHRFNVTSYMGTVILVERIDNTGEWREDMFPQVLE